MKFAVIGSRTITDEESVFQVLNSYKSEISVLITGTFITLVTGTVTVLVIGKVIVFDTVTVVGIFSRLILNEFPFRPLKVESILPIDFASDPLPQ